MSEAAARLRAMIERVTGHLEDGLVKSEADVEQYVLNPLLGCLGWDVAAPGAVRRQYPAKGAKKYFFDYVLFSAGRLAAVVEVKKPGLARKADPREQLLVYATTEGVPLGVYTDGWTWSFYLPLSSGSAEARLVRTVDLKAASSDEVSGILLRYLSCDRVRGGESRKAAEADRMRRFVRSGWERLTEGGKLVRPLADAARAAAKAEGVGNLNSRALHGEVRDFIKGGIQAPTASAQQAAPEAPVGAGPDEAVQSEREAPRQGVRPPGARARGAAWTYRGERRTEKNPTALFLAVIGRLHDDCGGTDFYRRLQARIRGRKRENLADSIAGTGVPERFIRSLPGGWYTHTNLPTKVKLAFLARAAEVAGISFDADGSNPGADLIVEVNSPISASGRLPGSTGSSESRKSVRVETAWTYRGERRTERNPTALFLAVIGRLHDDCGGTDFYVRLQARIRGRKRANLADSAVGTGVEQYARSLPGGWYIHIQLSTKAKLAFLARAAEVAGISFDADGSNPGADLIVEVTPKSR